MVSQTRGLSLCTADSHGSWKQEAARERRQAGTSACRRAVGRGSLWHNHPQEPRRFGLALVAADHCLREAESAASGSCCGQRTAAAMSRVPPVCGCVGSSGPLSAWAEARRLRLLLRAVDHRRHEPGAAALHLRWEQWTTVCVGRSPPPQAPASGSGPPP